MTEDQSTKIATLWRRYADNQTEAEAIRKELLSGNRVELLSQLTKALHLPGERLYALRLLQQMPVQDRQALMPGLLALATWQNQVTDLAREIVFSVPKDWLRANIIRCGEPLLNGPDHQEIWGMLDLTSRIDRQLALDLARRFTKHENPDIRDAGETYVAKLSAP